VPDIISYSSNIISGNATAYRAYAARYYGYYFKVLLDRMATSVAMPTTATRLNLQVRQPGGASALGTFYHVVLVHQLISGSRVCVWQVLSDSNITPLLTMLGAANEASRRPVWGSTLVFELWQGPRAPVRRKKTTTTD
jgi:hypothetical protein